MWWKKHKWRVIVPVCLLALLALAFWFGGNAPGLQGWKVEKRVTATATPAPAPTPTPTLASADYPQGDAAYSAAQGMELDPETGLDRYQTSAVPEGMPVPVEPEDVEISDEEHTCTLSISCATILDNMDWLDPEKVESVSEQVERAYLKTFPALKGRYSSHICDSADGVARGAVTEVER